jgi:hypothetical protein
MGITLLTEASRGQPPQRRQPSFGLRRNRKPECRLMRAMFFIYAAIIWGGLAAWLIVGLTHG